jgi:phosphate-selective porin OprO and OprP
MKQIVTLFLILGALQLSAQQIDNPVPYFTYSKGLGLTPPDSSFSLNLRFRMQNRFGFTTVNDRDLNTKEWEAVVRRLRLRMDGFVYNPKITYVIQLSFSRGDMDWDNTNFPNVIRDAMVFYRFNKRFQIGLGQGKLPGNRQRIISSGDQQMTDRSNFNSVFQVDRDYGLNLYYNNRIGKIPYSVRGTVSGGNGRNIEKTDELAFSGRAEVYPFGSFTNGGDYFEGDLSKETWSVSRSRSWLWQEPTVSIQRGTAPGEASEKRFMMLGIYAPVMLTLYLNTGAGHGALKQVSGMLLIPLLSAPQEAKAMFTEAGA